MELRLEYAVDGYRLEEIIDTTYDDITLEILSNITQVYIFDDDKSLYGNEAMIFLRRLINDNALLLS
ncbi:MAG: hypothetical protein IIY15_04815 [Flavobacteriales bacterium]|nr:hypothetical protein [Flavobacteriales bacterium]MBQ5815226.1 hypothetical protein [Flavobacteriales bacterium]